MMQFKVKKNNQNKLIHITHLVHKRKIISIMFSNLRNIEEYLAVNK